MKGTQGQLDSEARPAVCLNISCSLFQLPPAGGVVTMTDTVEQRLPVVVTTPPRAVLLIPAPYRRSGTNDRYCGTATRQHINTDDF